MKQKISITLSLLLLLGSVSATACSNNEDIGSRNKNVLRIASWDEYIDMGGEDSYYSPDSLPIYEEFEAWYNEGKPASEQIKVEYIALQDNETMYNKIKMGDHYDLLCPSEYMAMKLKAEEMLAPFPESFFDKSNPENYYAKNVSEYTNEVFARANLSEYIAGYMWGSTGFVYNPETIGETPEESRKIMSSWHCLTSEECERKITAKDNVRDSYLMGLGMYYENELLKLDSTSSNYAEILAEKMNDTTPETMNGVKKMLEKARLNLYGLETDEGKTDVIMGRLDASYQWSGDAVFILDEAESKNDLLLEYSVPKSASNLFFDGWVMMKDANQEAALAFVNFISRPENVVRNMYYIGYTSCVAGEEVYNYVSDTYSAEEGAENTVLYDLSYFFGEEYEPLVVTEDQTRRQLFAQYPDAETKNRLVVMDYFDKEENERANRMWNNIK